MRKILTIFFCVVLHAAPAGAQILVEQGKVALTAEPGETLSGTLNINNTIDQPIRVKAYLEDFRYLSPFEGKKSFSPAGTTDTSVSSMFKFLPQEFDMPAYGKRKVNYTIKMPMDAKGGYYGVLFFEKTDQNLKDITGVNIITRVGTLIFVESARRNKAAVIDNVRATPGGLTGRFLNKGDVVLLPQGVYYIMSKEGLAVDRGEVKKIYLPPGEQAEFTVEIPKKLTQGKYTIVITFDLADGDTVVKEIDISKKADGTFSVLQARD